MTEPARANVTPICPQCGRALDVGYRTIDPVTKAGYATCVSECGWAGPASLDLDWYIARARTATWGPTPDPPALEVAPLEPLAPPKRTRKK